MTALEPPFALDLTRRNTLAAQMEDCLRQAIASGRYRPGDALPTVREWAKMLGVSPRVPKTVIPRLVNEGLIVARPRHGCIVAPRGSLSFRGHVLVALPPEAHFGNANVTYASMARRLEDAGYLVSDVRVRRGRNGRFDLRSLDLALRQSVDVAVFLYREPAPARCARRLGVPFVTVGEGRIPGGIGHVSMSDVPAIEEMSRDFRTRGIRSVGLVFKEDRGDCEHSDVLRKAGMDVRMIPVRVDPSSPYEVRLESIMQGARDAFESLLSGTFAMPDALHFTDDYLVFGAVPVMLSHGVKVPEDVVLSSVVNYGRRPVFPFPLSMVEVDQYENGSLFADGILSYFDRGEFPEGIVLSPHYVSCRQAP